MKAIITDIKRFAVHDGDGIRTTVFFKGCPLKCVWCHNPEGLDFKPQLAFFEHKCVSCGKCVNVCPENAHSVKDGVHKFDNALCTACGRCVDNCLFEALRLYGRSVTADELLPLLLEDRDFYETSGGGVTLSGGECLMQSEFCAGLLMRLKQENIRTAVDTCGFVPRAALDRVAPFTDVFLYDIKAADEAVHIKCTGKPNGIILDNLRYLDEMGKRIEVRIPFVPEFNDGETEKIAGLLSELKNLEKVRVLPYHNFAASKYVSLGMADTLPEKLPDEQMIKKVVEYYNSYG